LDSAVKLIRDSGISFIDDGQLGYICGDSGDPWMLNPIY